MAWETGSIREDDGADALSQNDSTTRERVSVDDLEQLYTAVMKDAILNTKLVARLIKQEHDGFVGSVPMITFPGGDVERNGLLHAQVIDGTLHIGYGSALLSSVKLPGAADSECLYVVFDQHHNGLQVGDVSLTPLKGVLPRSQFDLNAECAKVIFSHDIVIPLFSGPDPYPRYRGETHMVGLPFNEVIKADISGLLQGNRLTVGYNRVPLFSTELQDQPETIYVVQRQTPKGLSIIDASADLDGLLAGAEPAPEPLPEPEPAPTQTRLEPNKDLIETDSARFIGQSIEARMINEGLYDAATQQVQLPRLATTHAFGDVVSYDEIRTTLEVGYPNGTIRTWQKRENPLLRDHIVKEGLRTEDVLAVHMADLSNTKRYSRADFGGWCGIAGEDLETIAKKPGDPLPEDLVTSWEGGINSTVSRRSFRKLYGDVVDVLKGNGSFFDKTKESLADPAPTPDPEPSPDPAPPGPTPPTPEPTDTVEGGLYLARCLYDKLEGEIWQDDDSILIQNGSQQHKYDEDHPLTFRGAGSVTQLEPRDLGVFVEIYDLAESDTMLFRDVLRLKLWAGYLKGEETEGVSAHDVAELYGADVDRTQAIIDSGYITKENEEERFFNLSNIVIESLRAGDKLDDVYVELHKSNDASPEPSPEGASVKISVRRDEPAKNTEGIYLYELGVGSEEGNEAIDALVAAYQDEFSRRMTERFAASYKADSIVLEGGDSFVERDLGYTVSADHLAQLLVRNVSNTRRNISKKVPSSLKKKKGTASQISPFAAIAYFVHAPTGGQPFSQEDVCNTLFLKDLDEGNADLPLIAYMHNTKLLKPADGTHKMKNADFGTLYNALAGAWAEKMHNEDSRQELMASVGYLTALQVGEALTPLVGARKAGEALAYFRRDDGIALGMVHPSHVQKYAEQHALE